MNSPGRGLNATSKPPLAKEMLTEPVTSVSVGPSQRLPYIIGGVVLAVVFGIVVLRGQGTEVSRVPHGGNDIVRETRAAERESDVDELRAKRARLETEIQDLEVRLKRADDAIRQLLSQENVSIQQVQSAFEGGQR